MNANDREAIRQWLDEQFSIVVEPPGPGTGVVTIVGLIHHAHSGDVPVHSMTSRQGGNWGKPDEMAQVFDAIATRHARGISGGGAQQFSLNICREGGKTCATLPFVRASAPAVVGGAGGYGLASEPPTAAGAMAQAQRLLEALVTGSFQQVQHVTTTQAQLVDKLANRLDVVEKRADERWLALQSVLAQWMQQSVSLQLRALGIEAGRKLLPLLPAALGTLTGNDRLVPPAEAEASLLDALLDNASPEQLQELLGTISSSSGGGGAALGAILSDHLLRAKKRREARAREHAELVAGWPTGASYDEAERDAAGEAVRALSGKPSGSAAKQANGHSNGNGTTHAPANGGGMEADAMLDTMLSSLNDGEVEQVALLFATKRPDIPGIAEQIKARYAALKGKAA